MSEEPGSLFGVLAVAWIAGLALASIVYRWTRGKPVLFTKVDGAEFMDRAASGNCRDSWYTRFGGASGCLVVAVARGRLVIRPWFPFTLLFLPEILRLECEIPVDQVRRVEVRGRRVTIDLVDSDRRPRSFALHLRQPDRLVSLLPAAAVSGMPERDSR